LQDLVEAGQQGTFDFAFIDADKPNYDRYYEYALMLVRTGGVIAVDNVFRGGNVIDPNDQTEGTVAIRALNKKIHADQRVEATMIPIGDGMTVAMKL
jgi:predicted O-methyltransferase YrrM